MNILPEKIPSRSKWPHEWNS